VSKKRRKVILPFAQRGIAEHQTPHYELCGNIKSRKLSQAVTILRIPACSGETWSLTLREERRLRVFENRVLRRVFGSKRDKVTGE